MNVGDIATLVTLLLTAGSLFLALAILRSDRRKEKGAQASGIVAWGRQVRIPPAESRLPDKDPFSCFGYEVHVWNTSNMPIGRVVVHQVPQDAKVLQATYGRDGLDSTAGRRRLESEPWLQLEGDREYVEPGERIVTRYALPLLLCDDLQLNFTDATGVAWQRPTRRIDIKIFVHRFVRNHLESGLLVQAAPTPTPSLGLHGFDGSGGRIALTARLLEGSDCRIPLRPPFIGSHLADVPTAYRWGPRRVRHA